MGELGETDSLSNITYCFSCLSSSDENPLQSYHFLKETWKEIFQVDQILLCCVCKNIAQRAEVFIQNVQSNQILLENFHDISDTSIHSVKFSTKPLVNLSYVPLQAIDLDGNDSANDETTVVYYSKRDFNVKIELKYENDNDSLDENGDNDFGEICESDRKVELQELETNIKEEDEYPLTLLKKELELEGINISVKKSSKKSKLRKKVTRKNKLNENIEQTGEEHGTDIRIEELRITKKACLQEREEKRLEESYLNSEYKCEDCIKGFSYKSSYDKHMEHHRESNGDFVCDVCKHRMATEDKLLSHQRYHTIRFRCAECGLTRINRITIEDHYRAKHMNGFKLDCPHCFKSFRRKTSLRKHMRCHQVKEKVQCEHCNKVFASKESLKPHIIKRHSAETGRRVRKHMCPECGKAFESPSQLKNHAIKHSIRKDYYCVECDKSFKTDYILRHHLKTAMSHNNYTDLPLPCLHCKKRFAIRRDLDRHMNRVHLNIKPHQCDQCEKAYINSWSLKEHRRLVHEGYKRPLRFPCPMCDKIFDRNHILKSHIRTHTGERPYQCSKCPAAFSQASILGTHNKLVHLKLTRDGRPKASLGIK